VCNEGSGLCGASTRVNEQASGDTGGNGTHTHTHTHRHTHTHTDTHTHTQTHTHTLGVYATMVTMVTMGGDLQPCCLADRLLTGLGQPQINP